MSDYTLEQLEKVLTSVLNTAADETRKGNKGLGDQIKSLQDVIGELRKSIKESDESKAIHDLADAARSSLTEARRNARNGNRQSHSGSVNDVINRNMRSLFQDLRRQNNRGGGSGNGGGQGPLNIDLNNLNRSTGVLTTAFTKLAGAVGSTASHLSGLFKVTDSVDGSFSGLLKTLSITNAALGMAAGMADNNINAYRMIMTSAEGTISSMDQLNSLAAQAGMSTKQFAESVKNGAASVKMLGGTTFAYLNRQVRDSGRLMGMLGGDVQAASEYLGDYLEMQRAQGNLDKMDLANVEKGIQKMVESDRKIAEMLGITTEEARKKKDEIQNDSRYMAAISGMSDDAQRQMQAIAQAMPTPEHLQMWKAFVAHQGKSFGGGEVGTNAAHLAALMGPQVMDQLSAAYKKASTGGSNPNDVTDLVLSMKELTQKNILPLGEQMASAGDAFVHQMNATFGGKGILAAVNNKNETLRINEEKRIRNDPNNKGLSDAEIKKRVDLAMENYAKAQDPYKQGTTDNATKVLLESTVHLADFKANLEKASNSVFLNMVDVGAPALKTFYAGLDKAGAAMNSMTENGMVKDIAGAGVLGILATGGAIAAISSVASIVIQGIAAAKLWSIMRNLSAAGGAAQGGGLMSRLFGGGAQAAGAAAGAGGAAQSAGLLSKLGNFAKVAGKFAGVAGGAYGLYDGISTVADHRNESFLGQKEGEGGLMNSRASGYGSAALGGAAVGGVIGSAFLGVGAPIGAAIGAGVGAGGAFAADQWQNVKDWWNGPSQPNGNPQNQQNQQNPQNQQDQPNSGFDYVRMATMFGDVMTSVLNNTFIKIDPSNWLPTIERHQVEHNELLRNLTNAVSPQPERLGVREPTVTNGGRTVTVPVQQAPGMSPFTPRAQTNNGRTPELTPDEYMSQTVELQKTQTRTVQDLVTAQRELRMAFEQSQAMMLQLMQQIEVNTRKTGQPGTIQ